MLNIIWAFMLLVSAIAAVANGRVEVMVNHIPANANRAIEIAVALIGVTAFWLGLMKVAEEGGAVNFMANMLKPLMRLLFPDVPVAHPAMHMMAFSLVSSMLGLNNASIPIAIRAMQALQKINSNPTRASNAMCLFLVITSSSIQLLPTTAIAVLVKAGSLHPTKIIMTTLLATLCSTICAILACLFLQSGEADQRKFML